MAKKSCIPGLFYWVFRPKPILQKGGIGAGLERPVPESMATAWVSRNMDKTDSLEASFFAIRQAIVEKLAKQRNLKISYDISYDPHDLYMDLAVCGEIEQIANLLEDLADQYGIAGIVVDLEKTEAAGSMIEGIEAGAFNVVIELDEA